jgi:hypothetical protein
MLVLSIDIGIVNLGFVFANIDLETDSVEVIKCNRVDITYIRHNRVAFCDCKLHHEYCIPDYLDHFIQENEDIFTEAEIILIERQPPVGITNVQDLIFTKFRPKIFFINPCTVHKHFNMSKDYSRRKEQSESICKKYLESFNTFNNILAIFLFSKLSLKLISDNVKQLIEVDDIGDIYDYEYDS